MKLIVNGSAVLRSSRGVRRYYNNISQYLSWPAGMSMSAVHNSGAINRLKELLYRGSRDAILWSPAQRGPLRALHHVVTVHDCINVEYTYRDDWRLPILRQATQQLLSNAEHIVAISHATEAALLRNYRIRPESLVVIPTSSDVQIASDLGGAPGIDGGGPPFILLVTNSLPHKNALRTCQALARSRARAEQVALRVVGSLPSEALDACLAGGISVEIDSAISDATLRDWYRGCRFLLAPSLSEGHDLPVAEALTLGVNVLCSDIAAHREFFDGLVTYFDPFDTEAISSAIDQALDRGGRWSPGPLPTRSFADVAGDYLELFSAVNDNSGRTGLTISATPNSTSKTPL
ncbi:MAG TPA: glycosyltransferase [Burkholderiaceae bacterium]